MEYNYIERIKQIKSKKKITNDALAEMTGIPLGTLSKMMAGVAESPKLSNIISICEALDVSLDYIVFGTPENKNNYTLEPNEIRLVEDYRKLDPTGRDIVSYVIKKESEREGDYAPAAKAVKPAPYKPIFTGGRERGVDSFEKRLIDLYDLPVSAGTGEYLFDSATSQINIPDNVKTRDADFALRINGNSMEPKYHNGDVLLVQDCESVEIGELGIFILDGQGYFKQFGGDRLISLNKEYSPIMLSDFEEIQCCGRVIGKLKRK